MQESFLRTFKNLLESLGIFWNLSESLGICQNLHALKKNNLVTGAADAEWRLFWDLFYFSFASFDIGGMISTGAYIRCATIYINDASSFSARAGAGSERS